MAVLLETTLGDVVIDLYTEERPRGEAPALLTFRRAALFFFPRFAFSAQSPAWTGWSFWADGAGDRAVYQRALVEKFVSEEQPFSASGAGQSGGGCL